MSEFYTQMGWKGDKYNASLSTKEIAKLVRDEIHSLYPKKTGWKISVRYKSFSGGSSIDVTIGGVPNELLPVVTEDHQYTKMADTIKENIEYLVSRYRWSDCDGMIDYFHVNFYSNVSYDWEWINKLLGVPGYV